MKGYEYTYVYSQGKGDTTKEGAPKVNWQKRYSLSEYSADIYPSDIAYDIKNMDYSEYNILIDNTEDQREKEALNCGSGEAPPSIIHCQWIIWFRFKHSHTLITRL